MTNSQRIIIKSYPPPDPKYINFIDYCADEIKKFFKGDEHSYLHPIYKTPVRNNTALDKKTFAVYWLTGELNKFWTGQNISEAARGRARLIKKGASSVVEALSLIVQKPACSFLDKDFEDFEAEDVYRIKYRYQIKYKAIFERKMGKAFSFSETISRMLQNDSDLPLVGLPLDLREFVKLCSDVIDYLARKKTVIMRDMRRDEWRFGKVPLPIFEQALNYWKKIGEISIYTSGHNRKFFNYISTCRIRRSSPPMRIRHRV